jgi:hypothetical protein
MAVRIRLKVIPSRHPQPVGTITDPQARGCEIPFLKVIHER